MFIPDSTIYELSEPEKIVSSYIVDDSHFVPMSEAVKRLAGSRSLTESEIAQAYDFVDGKDSGIDVPFVRSRNHSDLADLSSHIYNQEKDIDDKIKTAKKNAAIEAKYKEKSDK